MSDSNLIKRKKLLADDPGHTKTELNYPASKKFKISDLPDNQVAEVLIEALAYNNLVDVAYRYGLDPTELQLSRANQHYYYIDAYRQAIIASHSFTDFEKRQILLFLYHNNKYTPQEIFEVYEISQEDAIQWQAKLHYDLDCSKSLAFALKMDSCAFGLCLYFEQDRFIKNCAQQDESVLIAKLLKDGQIAVKKGGSSGGVSNSNQQEDDDER